MDRIIESIEDALTAVDAFEGEAVDFVLPISESLLDPVGINIAIITDKILKRGWEPNGFDQHDGYRNFRYKNLQE